MNRMAIAGLIGGGVLMVPAVVGADHRPGHQGGGNQANNVTIQAKTPVTWGRSTVVSGKVNGPDASGAVVDLEADPFPYSDGDFTTVATSAAGTGGEYRFTAQPQVNTRYRVTAKTSPPAGSSIVPVLVRIRVTRKVSDRTPRKGSRVRFAGKACPEHDGKTAAIQRRRAKRSWRTIARTTLRDAGEGRPCSKYARRVRVRRDGVYRVKVRSLDDDHANGKSKRIKLDAH